MCLSHKILEYNGILLTLIYYWIYIAGEWLCIIFKVMFYIFLNP